MAVTFDFVGHATFRLTIGEHRLVVDPFYTSNPQTEISANDVEADFILVTHGHFDHVEDLLAIALRSGAKVIANFEIINWLKSKGVAEEQTHPQHLGGGFEHPFGHLKLTIAHHGSGLPDGSYGGNPAGLLITAEDKRIYITGDTALFSDLALYGKEGVDLMVLPIGDNFTMGPDDALEAVKLVKPKQVVPCHYNTWPPIEQDPEAWKVRVEAETEASVQVLAPGDSLTL